jgi:hypothetical protein
MIYWTKEEDDLLTKLVEEGKGFGEMQLIFKRKSQNIGERSRKLGLKSKYKFKIHHHNEEFFKSPNFINCYFAGLLAADGNLNINKGSKCVLWNPSVKDLCLLEEFKKQTDFTGKISFYKNADGFGGLKSSFCRINIYSCNKWFEDLYSHFGLIPKKTERIPPPNITDINLKLCYLLGYTDGDGSISVDPKRNQMVISWVSSSYAILEWILNFTKELGLFSIRGLDIKIRKATETYWTLSISGTRAIHLFLILRNLNVNKLKRKWDNEKTMNVVNFNCKKHKEIESLLKDNLFFI